MSAQSERRPGSPPGKAFSGQICLNIRCWVGMSPSCPDWGSSTLAVNCRLPRSRDELGMPDG
eukprot:1730529-Amphidinium_carterae.2